MTDLKSIPELSAVQNTPFSKNSRPFFRMPVSRGSKTSRNSISMREIRTIPRKGRNTTKDIFSPPVSGREWWRVTLKETPVPGTYEIRDFLQDKELNQIKATYNFKGEGRKKKPGILPDGEVLLPGAYKHTDFLNSLDKRHITYQFTSSGRKCPLPGIKDKNCNVSPCEYQTARLPVQKLPVSHGTFKSQSSRFPTKYFKPREGPPPGSYDPRNVDSSPSISSSFKSRIPRFITSQTKVPGPAHYEPTIQSPQPRTLMKMGRMHGLFFRNSFEV